MYESFLFSGFGGQGVMFVGQLLSYAAMDEGYETTWIPSYGPEMRGGTAHCYVVISDKPIGSPLVKNPRTVIAFNNPSFDKYESMVAPGGLLVANSALITGKSDRTDIIVLEVPATAIADELGSLRVANLVLLGAALKANKVLPIEAIEHALDGHIPAHRRNLLETNYNAVRRGAEIAAGLVTV